MELPSLEDFLKDLEGVVEKDDSEKNDSDDRLLPLRAKKLLATTDLSPTANLISRLLLHQQDAKSLYNFVVEHFPNCIALKLCRLSGSSDFEPAVSKTALKRLYLLLSGLKQSRTSLHQFAVPGIEKAVISCLRSQQVPGNLFKILSKVVCYISLNVFMCSGGDWDELRDYIVSAVDVGYKKAASIVRELPIPLEDSFFMPILEKIGPETLSRLDPRRGTDDDEWILAFGVAFSLGIQLVASSRKDLASNIMLAMLESVTAMLKSGLITNELLLNQGIEDLNPLVLKNADKYEKAEYGWALELMEKIKGNSYIGVDTQQLATQIYEELERQCKEKGLQQQDG